MTPLLSVQGLTLDFYGVKVLQGVDLDVPAGGITGLIGPNGAGKSTLFNAVSGLHRPSGGQVRLAGKLVTGLRPDELVKAGMVRSFQLARGFPKLSVFQHLMLYGADQPGEGLIAALLGSNAAKQREAALAERAFGVARRLKLDHVLDNPITNLSGGQKKLVEIGRAMMADPKILLLDEPMAGVNPALADQIVEHLQALNREGLTICLIEHDMSVIRRLCDPVIVMAEGKRLTQGSFEQVVEDPRVQEAYLGSRR